MIGHLLDCVCSRAADADGCGESSECVCVCDLAEVRVLGAEAQRQKEEKGCMENGAGGRKQNKDRCQRAVVMPELIHSSARPLPASKEWEATCRGWTSGKWPLCSLNL